MGKHNYDNIQSFGINNPLLQNGDIDELKQEDIDKLVGHFGHEKVSHQLSSDKVSDENVLFRQQMAAQHELREFGIFGNSIENSDEKENKLMQNVTFRLFDDKLGEKILDK